MPGNRFPWLTTKLGFDVSDNGTSQGFARGTRGARWWLPLDRLDFRCPLAASRVAPAFLRVHTVTSSQTEATGLFGRAPLGGAGRWQPSS